MASVSDYFRSMFTSGMKESSQQEIELKGVSARGLEKLIEIVYTSSTTFESHSDLFEAISSASHLQCMLVLDYCEKNLLNRLTSRNFNYFIQMAKLYRMQNALKQIDLFIVNNLAQIINQSGPNKRLKKHQFNFDQDQDLLELELDPDSDIVGFYNLTYEQIGKCLANNELRMREIDLFLLTWQWIVKNLSIQNSTSRKSLIEHVRISEHKNKRKISIIRNLMKKIRFCLINPNDLIKKVQSIHSLMLNDKCLRQMVIDALNYHLIGSSVTQLSVKLRSPIKSLMLIGGREINPNPNIHDSCYLVNELIANKSAHKIRKTPLTTLPNNLSHMQCIVLENVLYLIGGCLSQCAHGESAVSTTYKYDPCVNKWTNIAQMVEKRAYFYACALSVHSKFALYAFGGQNRDASLCSIEKFNFETKKWSLCKSLPSTYYAHSGAVLNNTAYICGGYTNGQFSSELYSFNALNNQLQELRPMNVSRGWHSMCATSDTLFVFGGCYLNGPAQSVQQAQPTNVTECYSISTGQWSILKPMINLHKEASAIQVTDSSICIVGGYNIATKTGQKLVSRYNFVSDEWHTVGQLASGMTGVGCAILDLPWHIVHKESDKFNSSSSRLTHLADDLSDEEEASIDSSDDDHEFSIYTNSESENEQENHLKN